MDSNKARRAFLIGTNKIFPLPMNSFTTYLKNARTELTHVVWPTHRQALGHLFLIILISIFTAVIIAGLDYAFTQGVGYFVAQ